MDSTQYFLVAATVTALCFLLALRAVRSIAFSRAPKSEGGDFATSAAKRVCNCVCSCNGGFADGDMVVGAAAAAERVTGASMMEQLVPEITTHALSYLDYPSLCRLSMTNSLMRKAANDDNAWKALYHKVNCDCNEQLVDDNVVIVENFGLEFEAN
jgi:heme A synthase